MNRTLQGTRCSSDCWCSDCCNEELDGNEEVITSVNYEDPELYCWNCSTKIEAAYIDEDVSNANEIKV